MRTVIERKTPVFVHTAGARDVMETMRMFHDEFQLPVVISHGEFGGLQAAEEAASGTSPAISVRASTTSRTRPTTAASTPSPRRTRTRASRTCRSTPTAPLNPGDDLFVQGTISVRMGMDEDLALRALTINPARAVGIDSRVGSLEVGKDADIVIKRGSLFDPRNPIEKVLINGKVVYTHGQRRHGAQAGPAAPEPEVDEDGDSRVQPEEDFLEPCPLKYD